MNEAHVVLENGIEKRLKLQKHVDLIFLIIVKSFAFLFLALVLLILLKLYQASALSIKTFGFHFLVSPAWNPVTEKFGGLVPIWGTLITSLIALILGVPISFGIAFFLTELAPNSLKQSLRIIIELLAGIPSIIYGMWGLFILAPVLAARWQPWMIQHLGHVAIIGPLFRGHPLGIGILPAGVVLSIMIIPFVSSVMRDVFEIVPDIFKESAYALGATHWEVMWKIILPYSRIGVMGGITIGLGRALGETMAVAFVIGNSHQLSTSLLMPGSTISSVLANEYTEATGDMYNSALNELGLILFAITVIVFLCSRLLLSKLQKK